MIVELDLPARVSPGHAVPITVRVRNDAIEPAELELTGRPIAFDVVVQKPDGTEVWTRLRGAAVSMMLQVSILQPGEALEFAHEWDQRDNAGGDVAAGTYFVHGRLASPTGLLRTESRQLVISE